jgi:hypothetical protein
MHARLDLIVKQLVHHLVPLHQALALKRLGHNLNPAG